jgi:hypothetical protein
VSQEIEVESTSIPSSVTLNHEVRLTYEQMQEAIKDYLVKNNVNFPIAAVMVKEDIDFSSFQQMYRIVFKEFVELQRKV